MERLRFLDSSKGIFLVMIMYGHLVSLKYEPAFIDWMNSIKVVGFYVVSAYLFTFSKSKLSSKEYLIKSFKNIMYPYFLFSVFIFIFDVTFSLIRNGDTERIILIDITDTLTLRGIGTLWFLPTFFLANVLFKILLNKKKFILIISIPISLVIGLIFSQLYYFFQENTIVNNLLSRVILVLGKSAFAFYFLSISYFLVKYVKGKTIETKFVLGLLLTTLNLYMSVNNKHVDLNKFQLGSVPVLFLIGSVLGSIGIILILEYFYWKWNLNLKRLNYLGENSIIPMAVHNSFALIICIRYVVGIKVVEYSFSFFLKSLLGLFLLIFSQTLITKVLMKDRFKILFCKR
ncbi:hypothetical protein JZO73_05975 [Enterococcus plantarum]|uniref:acyltransferase family protein n=1 Tax=Enterococcus plantarum TaxID=1077675 RepID=UPI001A8EE848|nr:acyltransferase family protein [Enterococcus plantarum]MBO0467079.1 hypothetical protein [Enterococcus plantarum]